MAREPRKESPKDGLYRAFTKHSARYQKRDLSRKLSDLEKRSGGAKQAANRVGVSRETWRRWRNGSQSPRSTQLPKIDRADRETLVPPGRRQNIHDSTKKTDDGEYQPQQDPGMAIRATITVSDDERTRTMNFGRWLPPGAMDPAVDAFLAGDDDAAVDALNQAATDYIYSGHGPTTDYVEVSDIEWIEF